LIPKNVILRPEVNLGCSYIGYYLIYQGNRYVHVHYNTKYNQLT
jgi:hypothetical protein